MIEGSNADALLGLNAMRIVATEIGAEVTITIETTEDRVGCRSCGVIAKAHARRRSCECPLQHLAVIENRMVLRSPVETIVL